ncbi:MAG: hypothetical protein JXN64_12425 [Spirochaetes bacterium]|nr:hypothetical protein [Spirochaetota bacterium]
MHSINKFFILTIVFYSIVFSRASGNEIKPKNIIDGDKSAEAGSCSFSIFPQAGTQIDARLFLNSDSEYKAETHRIIDLDILRINTLVFSFYMNEYITFNNSKYLKPKSINYEMDYANFRWENRFGIASLFVDHNCANIFNKNETKDRQVRWYGLGIRWESYGIKTGRKDIKLNSNSSTIINNLNYRLSISRALHTRVLNYDYIATGILRYDIFRYFIFIPYIEASFTSLIDSRTRFNRNFETGVRIRFDEGSITPFLGLNRSYDIENNNAEAKDMYYIGLRMETLLGDDAEIKQSRTSEKSFFPDFHFMGSYGKYVFNDRLNFNTDIYFGLDYLSTYNVSPFINYALMHNSQKADAGMFPRYIEQNAEAGLSFHPVILDAFIEPYYNYVRYDEGNYSKGWIEKYSAAGLRILSTRMKPGYADNKSDFGNSAGLHSFNRIDWMLSASRVIVESHCKYTWEFTMQFRWDMFYFYDIVCYLAAGVDFLKSSAFDTIYNIEPGIRVKNGLYWMLFYKFEHRTDTDSGNGQFMNYHLTGIRFEI